MVKRYRKSLNEGVGTFDFRENLDRLHATLIDFEIAGLSADYPEMYKEFIAIENDLQGTYFATKEFLDKIGF